MASPDSATARRRFARLAAVTVLAFGLLAPALAEAATKTADDAPSAAAALDATTLVSDAGEIVTPAARDAVLGDAVVSTVAEPSEGSGDIADADLPDLDVQVRADLDVPALGAFSIIGTDNRSRVSNTTAYPYRAVARITSDIGQCTGWLINDDTLATAGHCVHTGGTSGRWAARTSVSVVPGQNGWYRPYGTCGARSLHSVLGWTRDDSWHYDYGVIKLNCTIGNTVGWFGYEWTSSSLTGASTTVSGYPGDKPADQWRSYDYVRSTWSRKLFYNNDTVGGVSGAPVYRYKNGVGPYSMAVHAYGTSPGYANNSGTRITENVFDNFAYWKAL